MEPRIASRREVMRTPYFTIVEKELMGGSSGDPFYAVDTLDYVTVLALTATDEILLVRQYRPAVETSGLELPSGHVDPGEEPEEAARRELLEETGFEAPRWALVGRARPDVGRLGNWLWCFVASGARPTLKEWVPEPGVEPRVFPARQFRELVQLGTLNHALDLATLCLAMVSGNLPAVFRPQEMRT